MKYRFLGYPDRIFPLLEHGKIYELVVVTCFLSKKPRIVKPFYCPYNSWRAFYKNWEPFTLRTAKLDYLLTKKHKKVKMNVEAESGLPKNRKGTTLDIFHGAEK